MAEGTLKILNEFADILQPHEPLAPYTYLRLGGPAEALAQPRSADELAALVRRCFERHIPLRVLGNGCSVLVRDEGVAGVVVRLAAPAFAAVAVQGRRVRAGAGAALAAVISATARHGLAGLETLVGIPGTVGGALRHPAGERRPDLGAYLRALEVIDADGQFRRREPDEWHEGGGPTCPEDALLITAELELETDTADAIIKRMRKAWILRKASQPPSFQAAGRAFRDPRGLSAAALIEQAHLGGTRVGGAQLSERNPNYLIVHPGATARDVLRLIDLVRSQVRDQFQVDLEMEMAVW
jgi:UDP-N-acetylmuramate dehydrogenase